MWSRKERERTRMFRERIDREITSQNNIVGRRSTRYVDRMNPLKAGIGESRDVHRCKDKMAAYLGLRIVL